VQEKIASVPGDILVVLPDDFTQQIIWQQEIFCMPCPTRAPSNREVLIASFADTSVFVLEAFGMNRSFAGLVPVAALGPAFWVQSSCSVIKNEKY